MMKYTEILNALRQGNISGLMAILEMLVNNLFADALHEARHAATMIADDEEDEFLDWCDEQAAYYDDDDEEDDQQEDSRYGFPTYIDYDGRPVDGFGRVIGKDYTKILFDDLGLEAEEDARYEKEDFDHWVEVISDKYETENNHMEQLLRDSIYDWSIDCFNDENLWMDNVIRKYEELSKKLDIEFKSPYEKRAHTEKEEEEEWYESKERFWRKATFHMYVDDDSWVDPVDAADVCPKKYMPGLYEALPSTPWDEIAEIYGLSSTSFVYLTTDEDRERWYELATRFYADYIKTRNDCNWVKMLKAKYISECLNIPYEDVANCYQ